MSVTFKSNTKENSCKKYVAERISSQRSKERNGEAMVGYFGGMEAAAKQQEAVGSKTIGSFSDRIVF